MSTSKDTDLLAPFEIWEVPLDNRTIKFHKPLVLTPEWLPDDPDDPDENEYLSVKCPELGIAAFGEDREELSRCLFGDMRFAWKHHVLTDVVNLTREAKMIRDNYLAIAEVVDG